MNENITEKKLLSDCKTPQSEKNDDYYYSE